MNKFDELYSLMKLSADYANYIRYDYKMDEIGLYDQIEGIDLSSYTEEDFIKLKLSHAAIVLSFQKDHIIEKQGKNNFKPKVINELLEDAALMVAKKNNNKYIVGPFLYDSNSKVIDVIRNKITHGDYYIEGTNIVFSDKDQTSDINVVAKVPINDISKMSMKIAINFLFKLNNSKKRNILIGKKLDTLSEIKNKHDLQKVCKNFYTISFTDYPMKGKERNLEYIATLENFINLFKNNLQDLIAKYPDQSLNDLTNYILNLYKNVLDNQGINLRFEIKSYYNSGKYETIKKEYEMHQIAYNGLLREQIALIGVVGHSVLEENMAKDKIRIGSINNLLITEKIIDPNFMLDRGLDIIPVSDTYLDDITICSLLSSFYIFFQYGLENTYSKSNETKLEDIASRKYFDFSLLDLSPLESDNMKTMVSFKSFNNELITIEKDFLQAENNYNNALDSLKKYRESCVNKNKEEDQEIIKKIQEKIIDLYYIYINKKEIYVNSKDIMSRFDLYVKNYNILLNIRDSIAHGNYELINGSAITKDPLLDAKLIFDNIYDNSCNYHKEVVFNDFTKIFCKNNIDLLISFVDYNCNKEKIDKVFKIKK